MSIKQRPKLELYNELKEYISDIQEDLFRFLGPRIDTFARCLVNGSTFSSAYNRTDRGQMALIYCVDKQDKIKSKTFLLTLFKDGFFTARVHLKDLNGATMLRVYCDIMTQCSVPLIYNIAHSEKRFGDVLVR